MNHHHPWGDDNPMLATTLEKTQNDNYYWYSNDARSSMTTLEKRTQRIMTIVHMLTSGNSTLLVVD